VASYEICSFLCSIYQIYGSISLVAVSNDVHSTRETEIYMCSRSVLSVHTISDLQRVDVLAASLSKLAHLDRR